ncbi:ATP-binding protein [Streptomyces albus]|uniref:ATP-binding protein n=1 Tax=Streptomyces albus TaxID=1888 RepID=UPI003F4CFF4D
MDSRGGRAGVIDRFPMSSIDGDSPSRNDNAPPSRNDNAPAGQDIAPEGQRVPAPRGTWRFTAPTADHAVPRLRHAVRDLLERQPVTVPRETRDTALLILSELVTNAVRHAALLSPRIGVEISLEGGRLTVAVEDDHPYRPKALEAAPMDESTGGRGLLLVRVLTAEAGGVCDVTRTGTGGKVVWAALPLTGGP